MPVSKLNRYNFTLGNSNFKMRIALGLLIGNVILSKREDYILTSLMIPMLY